MLSLFRKKLHSHPPAAGLSRAGRSPARPAGAPNTPAIDLLAIDIDGTLLRSDETITPNVVKAVQEAIEAGVKVVLATARPPQEVRELRAELKLNTFQINYNGALICAEGGKNILYHRPLEAEVARKIFRTAREIDPSVQVRVDIIDHWFTDRENKTQQPSANHWKRQAPKGVQDLEEVLTQDVTRLVMLSSAVNTHRIRKRLEEEFGRHITMPFCGERVLMITHARANKAEALKRMAEHYRIPRERVMAIGDAPNDIPMLKWAGYGIAMVNAWMKALQAADILVASNDRDGVAEAIRKYVLNSGPSRR